MELEKMLISFRRAALLSVIMLGVCTVKAQKDPCSMTTRLSGGTVLTGNVTKYIGNGYHAEIWKAVLSGDGEITCFGGDADCAFKASWYNCGDFLAHVGYSTVRLQRSIQSLDGSLQNIAIPGKVLPVTIPTSESMAGQRPLCSNTTL